MIIYTIRNPIRIFSEWLWLWFVFLLLSIRFKLRKRALRKMKLRIEHLALLLEKKDKSAALRDKQSEENA